MCKIDVNGATVTATWSDDVARLAPASFEPGEVRGNGCGGPVTTLDLGDRVGTLFARWRTSVPNGKVKMVSKKVASFTYPTADDAQAHLVRLYELINECVGRVAQTT